MLSKIITTMAFLSVCGFANANVLCSAQIQKKAEDIAESKIGGTCIAGSPEVLPESNLRGTSGTVSGTCRKNISQESTVRVPFSYSFSVSAIEFNEGLICDGAFIHVH